METIVNSLPPNPDITILLDGLLAICINKKVKHPTSEVGVFPFAKDHILALEVKKITQVEGGKPEEVILFSSRKEILTGDIVAMIEGQKPQVQVFEKEGDEQDFRRVIDLEGPRFHKKKLNLVKGIIRQKIYIKHGIYHAIGKRNALIKPAFAEAATLAGITAMTQEVELPTHIGVNVYLPEGQTFCLQFGTNPAVKFEMQKETGVSYEISVSNNCRKEEDGEECLSDFQSYYILADVSVPQRFDIENVTSGQIGSDRTPCDTIYCSQTTEFP